MKQVKHGRFALAALTALLLCCVLTACGGDREEADTSGEDALAALAGWWYMPEDYSEGIPIMEIFYLDAAKEAYTSYDKFRNVGFEGAAWIGDDGDLGLSVDVFGDIYLTPGPGGLYDEEGELAFVPGDPLEAADVSTLSGRWFLGADTTSDYYELYDDGSFRRVMAATAYSEEYVMSEGTFALSAYTASYQVGGSVEEMHIVFGDDLLAPEGILSPGQTLFRLSDYGDTLLFVREEALGWPEASVEIAWATICTKSWRAEDGTTFLLFFPNGAFELMGQVELEGGLTYETAGEGVWSIAHGLLSLEWADGSDETCSVTEEIDSFYVASMGLTFLAE